MSEIKARLSSRATAVFCYRDHVKCLKAVCTQLCSCIHLNGGPLRVMDEELNNCCLYERSKVAGQNIKMMKAGGLYGISSLSWMSVLKRHSLLVMQAMRNKKYTHYFSCNAPVIL